MTVEHHQSANGTVSSVAFSDCGTYRYLLDRTWNGALPRALFVMLNPSTADAHKNDQTIARCEKRARAMNFGTMRVVNLFAYRATEPRDMIATPHPVGPDNDATLDEAIHWLRNGDLLICAWGNHGAHLDRSRDVQARLRVAGHPLYHLGLNISGEPRHALHPLNDPQLWNPLP